MMTGEVAVPFVANSLHCMSSLGTGCFYTEVASADLSQARKLLSTAVMAAALTDTVVSVSIVTDMGAVVRSPCKFAPFCFS